MKTNTSILCRLAAVAALVLPAATLPSFAQTTATTDPVGFVTIAVAGNGGSGQPAYTFTSIGMTNAVAYQATTTQTAGSGNSVGGSAILEDGGSTWANNAYNGAAGVITHYVEIVSGPGAGTTYDITATDATTHTLTLGGPLLNTIVVGASYKIRPHWTIAGVFGATNQAGLFPGSSSTADQIQFFRNGGYVSYYYKSGGGGGTGWRGTDSASADASGTVIYPDEGFVVKRNQSTSVSVVVQGAVKTGQTSMPVLSGYSLLGNVYASGMTLGSSGLYSTDPATGVAPGSSSSADQILLWDTSTNGFLTYYYKSGGGGGSGWRSTTSASNDASGTPIPLGSAIFVKRNSNPFNWLAPQHPTSFN